MQDKNRPEVNVKKVTKNYEIIEVNGFAIKRRKSEKPAGKTADSRPTNLGQVQEQAYHTPTEAAIKETATQRTPNVEEYEISAELYDRLTKALHDFQQDGPVSGRLLAICSSVCAAEMDMVKKSSNAAVSDALETIFESFLNKLSTALDEGSIAVAPSEGKDFAQADLKIDIESRKLGLKRRLEILEKEEKEWSDLLSKVDSLDLEAPMYPKSGAENPSTSMDMAAEEIQELQALKDSIQKQLTMQVEGVSLVVGNIEDLIEQANEKAALAQKQYHSERFKTFPHVNSPARLIKAIVHRKDHE
eukprot:jgi/Picsp_1/4308/NSC_01816-R1_hypothetical protein CHLREDRAFT_144129 [Chlamydomonas reinhardtii]